MARISSWMLFALLAFALLHPVSAAPVLPAATNVVDCSSNNPSNVIYNNPCTLQGASAFVAQVPYVALEANVSSAPGVASLGAFAALNYYFEVVGGNVGDAVPVLLSTNLLTQASYANYAFSSLVVSDGSNLGARQVYACTGDSCVQPSEFHGSLSYTALSGQILSVSLEIEAAETYTFGGTAFASADPYIHVDPDFARASDYSIIVSDGVSNSPPPNNVPEPASWVLMLLGVGLLGIIKRCASVNRTPQTSATQAGC